ncbi:hypothetical protein [Archangium primigenium]|uniref:hypothetical protein n=1 Tax=[Archangium] primigenium TaxID=2792470 RepID=UPI001959346F|nr:hypothetical protein [Archangium primigenium]MBM7112740.1 hypothetical protein [Archangium primigenium]
MTPPTSPSPRPSPLWYSLVAVVGLLWALVEMNSAGSLFPGRPWFDGRRLFCFLYSGVSLVLPAGLLLRAGRLPSALLFVIAILTGLSTVPTTMALVLFSGLQDSASFPPIAVAFVLVRAALTGTLLSAFRARYSV